MKKIVIVLFLSFFIKDLLGVVAINDQRVQKHKEVIHKTFRIIKYGKIGVSTVSLLAFSYVAWQLGKDLFGSSKENQQIFDPKIGINEEQYNNLSQLLVKHNELLSKPKKVSFFHRSTRWLKNSGIAVGTFVAQGVVGSVCLGKFNNYLERFFGDHNLTWFLQERTCFKLAKIILEKNINRMIDNIDTFTKEEYEQNCTLIKENCVDFLLQIEKIVAFMEYSIEQLDENNIHVNDSDRLLPINLTTRTNNFIMSVYTIIENMYKEKPQKIEAAYVEYTKNLNQIIDQFNFLEARSEWFLNV